MRPNIICKLTPDAVALLQLAKGKSIDIEEIGTVTTNGTATSHAPKSEPRGSGTRTTNGVLFKVYRKKQHMDQNAALAAGAKPLRQMLVGRPIGKAYTSIIQSMRVDPRVAEGKVKVIQRSNALKLVQAIFPKKTPGACSSVISRLYKFGALRVVL